MPTSISSLSPSGKCSSVPLAQDSTTITPRTRNPLQLVKTSPPPPPSSPSMRNHVPGLPSHWSPAFPLRVRPDPPLLLGAHGSLPHPCGILFYRPPVPSSAIVVLADYLPRYRSRPRSRDRAIGTENPILPRHPTLRFLHHLL